MEDASVQTNNVWTDKYFAIAMGAIIVLFSLFHWGSLAFSRYGPQVPGKKLGQTIARRMGWISVANFVLLVFLALRNTPIAPLSGQSYEKLRPLHKIAGYTCIVSSVTHGILFLKESAEIGYLELMSERENLSGALAGLSMVIIGLSTISWFASRYYEAFYIIHVVLFILIVILVGMHRPEITTSTLAIVIFIACIWLLDRSLRASRFVWNFFGNYATLTPMQDGAVRVKLQRGIRCSPGSHAFIWMPSIRFLETHPFTMISADPVELLVRQYDGYTHELYKFAHEQPGRTVRCSMDGGYGQVPNFMNFDKIILVAGGSGATFTIAIAIDLLSRCAAANVTKQIDFIWTVKYSSSLKWFQDEVGKLQDSPLVNLFVHISQDDLTSHDSSRGTSPVGSDMEKGKDAMRSLENPSCIRKGRPDISEFVASGIACCPLQYKVGIGACGPMKILEATRRAASQKVFDDGPSITLHIEEFEW
ncbi:hypothetical protein N7466_008602 [Penicillium verhagenii]|uniref:uncharacterized protein n=1 Tax=Penicillium verhagenii TaxID=1562060 RepID=UPI0025451A9F|nr:uncharacterized protein N7466_008602 [Penicillium verhagenii]KAJ5924415.1 hypothetical protein N7466_008602 [Penicillium verhagenii]